MTLHVPRLPFALDPLIGEAKRRARQRRFLVVSALLLAALATGLTLGFRSSGGGPSGLALHAGPTRTFATAHTGDRITCRSDGYSLTVTVPSPRSGAFFKQRTISPTRRLAINLGRKADGRVWVLCRWR